MEMRGKTNCMVYIFLRSTITVARIYVGAAEAAEGRPRRHKEEEEESHRGHPIFPPSSLQNEINSWLIRLGINIVEYLGILSLNI